MATKQGDIALLNDPIAKELLQSTILARFAYVGSDGTPRVIPIWFHEWVSVIDFEKRFPSAIEAAMSGPNVALRNPFGGPLHLYSKISGNIFSRTTY